MSGSDYKKKYKVHIHEYVVITSISDASSQTVHHACVNKYADSYIVHQTPMKLWQNMKGQNSLICVDLRQHELCYNVH